MVEYELGNVMEAFSIYTKIKPKVISFFINIILCSITASEFLCVTVDIRDNVFISYNIDLIA
jgi:hypothetical protein